MKEELNYLEIIALVRELKNFEGSKVNKIYQTKKNEIILCLYHPKIRKIFLRITVPHFLSITEYKEETPEKPSEFVMFLRKYLLNSYLYDVIQPHFERIIEFHFEKEKKFILICELFSKGNIIICDKDYKILVPLSIQIWRDRTIRPKEKYNLPPKEFDIENLDFNKFKSIIALSKKNQIVKVLATEFNLGGIYAEELCLRSGIEKSTNPNKIDNTTLRIIFRNFLSILEEANETKLFPHIVFKDKKPVDVLPFKLEQYKNFEFTRYDSFMKALDDYFIRYFQREKTELKESEVEREIAKQEFVLKQNQQYLNEILQKSAELKNIADIIYQNLTVIQDIFLNLRKAKEMGMKWNEIIKRIEEGKAKGNKASLLIKKISPEKGTILLDINNGLELDFTKNVTEIADEYYTKAKKLEAKLTGIKETIENLSKKVDELRQKQIKIREEIEKEIPTKIVAVHEEWYERFWWFFTSNGKLAIAGRDATQNEIIIKKYTEPNDLIFHTEAPGSPFLVLKNGVSATISEKIEAATFVLCRSKAWKEKIISRVYAVKPEQISKQAPSGEYITKGAFMIYGKKEFIKDVELRLAIGIEPETKRLISGPVDNVRQKSKYYIILIPGEHDKDTLAKAIKNYFTEIARSDDKTAISKISLEAIKKHITSDSDILGIVNDNP